MKRQRVRQPRPAPPPTGSPVAEPIPGSTVVADEERLARSRTLVAQLRPILGSLNRMTEFRWTTDLQILLLTSLARCTAQPLALEQRVVIEQTLDPLLELYTEAVTDWWQAQGRTALPLAYRRLQRLIRRSGDALWQSRGQRLAPLEYLRLGRSWACWGPPEVSEPWFTHHPRSLRAWTAEILATPGARVGLVAPVDLALRAATHEQDWALAAEIAGRDAARNPFRYPEWCELLLRAGQSTAAQAAARQGLADPQLTPALRQQLRPFLVPAPPLSTSAQ